MSVIFDETNLIKTSEHFEISHGNTGRIGYAGKYDFDSFEEASQVANNFKANPRSHNPKMADDDVKYWKEQFYTILKVKKVEEQMDVI